MRFTEDELILIKTTFGGNERLVKLLRKIFLPLWQGTWSSATSSNS